jgi:hypothetical protein
MAIVKGAEEPHSGAGYGERERGVPLSTSLTFASVASAELSSKCYYLVGLTANVVMTLWTGGTLLARLLSYSTR